MKKNSLKNRHLLPILGFLAFSISSLIAAPPAQAQLLSDLPSNYRLSFAGGSFESAAQFAYAYNFQGVNRLRAHHWEFAVGVITSTDNSRPFVSLGPVWRMPLRNKNLFMEFGFSPTIIGGSNFDSTDLGGNLHFTSSISLGGNFGKNRSSNLSLRLQHISNGGLNDTNPGLDLIGISFTHQLNRR